MKKITTLVFACLLGAVAYGQGISGGVKAGLNLANQTFSGNGITTSPSFLPSFHGGGYVTAMFSEHFGLQPELLYSIQGAKSGSGDESYNLGYVTVPVLVRYSVNSLISFHAGPQIGLLTSAKHKYASESVDMKDDLTGTDIGIAAGMSFDLPMKLNLTVRFIKGMSNINDTGSTTEQRNYNLQFSVGYKLFGK